MRKERSKAKPKAVRATSPEEFDGWSQVDESLIIGWSYKDVL